MDTTSVRVSVINAYDDIAEAYWSAYQEADEADWGYWEDFLIACKGKKVLDMGCGTGDATVYMYKRGINVCGMDLSDGMLRMATKNSDDIFWIKGDVCNCPFPDKSFDGIVLSYTINHLNKEMCDQTFKEINRLLRDEGYLLVAYHVGEGEELVVEPLNPSLKIYYRYYTRDYISELLPGFRLISYNQRESLNPEELLNDKAFSVYKKVVK